MVVSKRTAISCKGLKQIQMLMFPTPHVQTSRDWEEEHLDPNKGPGEMLVGGPEVREQRL